MSSNTVNQDGVSNGQDQNDAPNGHGAASTTQAESPTGGSNRSKEACEEATGAGERPTKKVKRAKYITRACTSCQQRKIKCDGSEPCGQCVAKKRTCVSVPRKHEARNDWEIGGDPNSSLSREILDRLASAERQLRILSRAGIEVDTRSNHELLQRRGSSDEAEEARKPTTEFQKALEVEGQTFAGELSITPNLEQSNNDGPSHHGDDSSPSSFVRPLDPALSETGSRKIRGWLEKILIQHGIAPDEQKWRRDLAVYMEEVHPLYAFLHPPTVWETFDEMWEYSALWSITDTTERREKHISLALVFFCIALGRCSVSSRMRDESGVYSSGFGMYSVGMALLQNVMELGDVKTRSLPTLQVLILRVIYLFRLDANQQASQVLALLVSIAHATGLHRQSTLDPMPAFYNQLHCRVWWVIYALDRRIALESGKPYLIQDRNVDTAFPLDLTDDWLSRYQTRPDTVADLQSDILTQVAENPSQSAVPYLIALIRYSRAAAKAWEILYGVKASSMSASAMVDYVDTVLGKLLDAVPECLRYDPDLPCEPQFSNRLRWQIKQTMLLFTCCTYVRVLIQKPFIPMSRSAERGEDDELESATACASLAASVLTAHQKLNDNGIKYSFALSHYVTSCTMIMLGLVSREPGFKRRYGDLLLAAARSLNMYCHEVWVSGKMMRLVSKLTRLVQRTLNNKKTDGHVSERHNSGGGNMHQQLTPHSEDQEGCHPPQVLDSSMPPPSITDDGIEHVREWDLDGHSAKPRILTANVAERRYTNEEEDQHRFSTSWMGRSSLDERTDRGISDLDFRAIIDGSERYGLDFRSSGLLADQSLGGLELSNARVDRDFGEFRLGALGLSNVTDLEVTNDPSLADLFDNSPMMNFGGLG
ncbi:unnamed protein product [Clonostachys solani]|uniref:Zn(2)-C6 fungal-type domain-containing protein n=1 Tax=Clonostachys solani TaxID=160281 RepID=A0A9N9ZMV6_9HYPO|nr:unnamed protein product [Clonostachys solani]